MPRQPSQVQGLPGYVWFYEPAHGYRGRHAYNSNTGVALSYRQVQNIRSGRVTETQAVAALSMPMSQRRTQLKPGYPLYRISAFSSLYGAWAYAATSRTRSYIVGYGMPYYNYPSDVHGYGYRTLGGTANASGHRRRSIFAYYHMLDEYFDPSRVGSPRNPRHGPFFVWEETTDVSTYRPRS